MISNKKIVLSYENKATQTGSVELSYWSKAEQMKKSILSWVSCWILAIVSIFLPGLHFVLVPTFLVLGPALFFYFSRQQAMIISGKGKCPHCNEKLLISKGPLRFPIEELCTACRKNVIITLAAD